jgi:ABC-type tungstate transport system substrate-binding protein
MLSQMQKEMLQTAAREKQLNLILALSYIVLDVETVQYIVQQHASDLSAKDLQLAQHMLQEMQFEVAAANSSVFSTVVN